MTAIVIHGTAAKIVLIAIYLGLAAVFILALLVFMDWAHEKIEGDTPWGLIRHG